MSTETEHAGPRDGGGVVRATLNMKVKEGRGSDFEREWRAIADSRSELRPFLYAVLLFSLSYLGIAISLFPMIVPHHYDLWQAASSPDTQIFLGVGTLFLLPVILVYTGWSYWVFRGKVRADTGYH